MLEQFEQMVDMWLETYSSERVQDYLDKGDVAWKEPTQPCKDQASDTGFRNTFRSTGLFTEVHGRIRPKGHSHARGWDVVRGGDFDSNGKPGMPRSVLLASLPITWDGLMEMDEGDEELLLADLGNKEQYLAYLLSQENLDLEGVADWPPRVTAPEAYQARLRPFFP